MTMQTPMKRDNARTCSWRVADAFLRILRGMARDCFVSRKVREVREVFVSRRDAGLPFAKGYGAMGSSRPTNSNAQTLSID